MPSKFAEILLPKKIGPTDKTLTYSIPEFLKDVGIGQLVEVPLRNRKEKGIITSIHSKKPSYSTKEIERIIPNAPHLAEWQIQLMHWIADYYFAPLFKSLRLFLPASFVRKKKLKALPTEESALMEQELKFKHTLSEEQQKAIQTIKSTDKKICLVHGITGSGKTEIYLHIVENALKEGKQVLILIPEISLTPQMCQRFQAHFNEKTVAIHSQLTPKQKEQAWQSIHQGEAKIIIGSRSAIFAPFQNLAYIIIDEEHDNCYKQDQSPLYDAKEVAKKMAELLNITVVMGSATPTLETYYQATSGEIELIELSQRPTKDNLSLPKAKIIDLRAEINKKNYSIFSEDLQHLIEEKLSAKEQIILFLNRRGAASAVLCRTCGFVVNCPNCDIPMTYHRKMNVEGGIYNAERLVCHHCAHMDYPPKSCPQCKSAYIKFIGLGTQRVEEEINKLFPEARTLRADRDTTQKREQFKHMYETFKKGDADILIGTQMVAIGLHFPKVNLVGIILADVGLTIPDLRSSEKTFQLITQVAGRAGREKQGQAIIQSYLPNHYAIQAAANHDYHGFYEKEIALRKELNQPPFNKLAKITFKHNDNKKALNATVKLFHELEELNITNDSDHEVHYFPALIPRLHNKYRWHILISGPNPSKLLRKIKDFNGGAVDIDPLFTV